MMWFVFGLCGVGIASGWLGWQFWLGFLASCLVSKSIPILIASELVLAVRDKLLALGRGDNLRDKYSVPGTDHVAFSLNFVPPKPDEARPRTNTWVNLGFREESSDPELSFVESCEALAQKLAEAAQLSRGQSVLDVGCGCADQDVFFCRALRPQDQPARICAVELDHDKVAVGRRLVQEHNLSDRVTVCQGSATHLTSISAVATHQPFDTVLSLDSAYHYRPRTEFFAQSSQVLCNGGRLAVSDLVLAQPWHTLGWSRKLATRIVLALTDVPVANAVCAAEYCKQLERAGFENVRVDEVSDEVLGGFSGFAERRVAALEQFVLPSVWLKFVVTGKVLRWLHRSRLMNYVIVTAQKAR